MYTPVFQDEFGDESEWWRLLRALVARVYKVDIPNIGKIPRQSKSLKTQLAGRQLSPSVREWMALAMDVRKCDDAAVDMAHYNLQVTGFPEEDSISLNKYYEGMQWVVACRDLDQEDPPVSAYEFVQSRDQFVLRKSYGQVPVTQFALHTLLNYAPGYAGWKDYAERGCVLKNPKSFIEKLRRTKGSIVSDTFGSLTLVEGTGWMAYIQNGYGLFGSAKVLEIRFTEGVKLADIPKPIREKVRMKPSHLRLWK